MSNAAERKEKQKWAIEKPKLDNARKVGNSDGSRHALQDQEKQVRWDL